MCCCSYERAVVLKASIFDVTWSPHHQSVRGRILHQKGCTPSYQRFSISSTIFFHGVLDTNYQVERKRERQLITCMSL